MLVEIELIDCETLEKGKIEGKITYGLLMQSQ